VTHPVVQAVKADITALEVDAVVNAANPSLVMGGGVDEAIHEAAGEDELSAALAAIGHCDLGDAVSTAGFGLPARWIIHAVGPVWEGGRSHEPDNLASAYRRSVQVADELGAASVAIPAISTGIFGYPKEEAAEIAVTTVRSLETTNIRRVILVAFDEDTLRSYHKLLRD